MLDRYQVRQAILEHLKKTKGRYYNHLGQMVHSDSIFSVIHKGISTLFVPEMTNLGPGLKQVDIYKLVPAMIDFMVVGVNTDKMPTYSCRVMFAVDEPQPDIYYLTSALASNGYNTSEHYVWATGQSIHMNHPQSLLP